MTALGRAWAALALVVLAAPAAAVEPLFAPEAPLRVAVREVPPFAMRDRAGNWEGLSVELWQDVADKLGWEFGWVEMSLEETLVALESGDVDVAVAALTLTAERERRFDFSHAYFVSGLSLAHAPGGGNAWTATLRGFLSLEFVSVVGSLALVLLAAGFAVWLFERRANADQFGRGNVVRGLGDGFWWSAVTMTTVGYGDKAPRTVGGRVVALVWMFASLIIIASFTAGIAASLTANRLESDLLRSRGLSRMQVGVLEGSSGERFASERGAVVRPFGSVDAALEALARGDVDAVLHDAPVLKHRVRSGFTDLVVAPQVLVRDDYGFGLARDGPLREDVNAALLSILHEPVWHSIRNRHLGADAAE